MNTPGRSSWSLHPTVGFLAWPSLSGLSDILTTHMPLEPRLQDPNITAPGAASLGGSPARRINPEAKLLLQLGILVAMQAHGPSKQSPST